MREAGCFPSEFVTKLRRPPFLCFHSNKHRVVGIGTQRGQRIGRCGPANVCLLGRSGSPARSGAFCLSANTGTLTVAAALRSRTRGFSVAVWASRPESSVGVGSRGFHFWTGRPAGWNDGHGVALLNWTGKLLVSSPPPPGGISFRSPAGTEWSEGFFHSCPSHGWGAYRRFEPVAL
jgi:hypothetical protein